MITMVLFVLAAALFFLASIGVTTKVHLGWMGAFVLALAFLFGGEVGGG